MGAGGIMSGEELINETDLHLPRKTAHTSNALNNLMSPSTD